MILKHEYTLKNETYCQWLKLKHTIPHKWNTNSKQSPGKISNFLIQGHHLIKEALILAL